MNSAIIWRDFSKFKAQDLQWFMRLKIALKVMTEGNAHKHIKLRSQRRWSCLSARSLTSQCNSVLCIKRKSLFRLWCLLKRKLKLAKFARVELRSEVSIPPPPTVWSVIPGFCTRTKHTRFLLLVCQNKDYYVVSPSPLKNSKKRGRRTTKKLEAGRLMWAQSR